MENKLIWKSNEEMLKELKKRISSWKQGDSRDGKILSAEGKFVYRGIAYLIKVMRYYNHTNNFTTMGNDRISDSHAVVEYPEETEAIRSIIPYDYGSEWLYHDTLHSWNDKQTTEEQIEVCHKWAREDIDNLLDGEIAKKIDEAIKALQDVKDKLKSEVKKLK